jgi:hypothetical protein
LPDANLEIWTSLQRRIKKCAKERNRIVHSMKLTDFSSEEEKRIALCHSIFDVRPHLKASPGYLYHYSDLDAIARRFGGLSQDLFEFASKLPEPPGLRNAPRRKVGSRQ